MEHLKKINGLSPLEYEHLFDAKAIDTLKKTPGLDSIIRQFNKLAIEKIITIQYTGSNLRISKENYPDIYNLLDIVCDVINLPKRPNLYIEWAYNINGFTAGVDYPIIVITSGAIDLLTEKELLFLIGHEVGHIKSRHTLYHQMANFFPLITNILGEATLGLGKLLSTPIELALLRWSRMSEFTADRAGLLACQDLNTAACVMAKWAGMPKKHYDKIKFEHFLNQAREFDTLDYDNLNKFIKIISIMTNTHPWTVIRAAELLKWVDSGEYDDVLKRDTTHKVCKSIEGDSVFCRNCSYRLAGKEKYCPSCGNPLQINIHAKHH